MIAQEQWHNWKHDEVTEVLFTLLKRKREEMKENLILDRYENESVVKGKALMIQELLELDYETLIEEIRGE